MRSRIRIWGVGLAAIVAALVLATGASRSGETGQFDTVSDVIGTQFNALPRTTSDVIFDESVVHTYEINVLDEDWEWLNDNPLLEEYVPATLTFNGRAFEDVAVRYKGFYGNLRFCFDQQGNQTCEKLSFKLKFSEYEPSRRFFGLQRLNFHSMNGDLTKMHDALGYGLFREAGVPAPRTAYARLIVNGELLGLFSVVEQVDAEFVWHAFPDAGRGTLYKEVWPERLDEAEFAEAVVVGDGDEVEAMVRFTEALLGTDDEAFLAVLEDWVDPDAFWNYLALDRLMDNWDGIVAWYCPGTCFNHNFFWYEEAFTDQVWLIPWDLDHIFEFPSPIRTYFSMPDWDAEQSCRTVRVFLGIPGRPPSCDPVIHKLATAGWDDYVEASRRMLDGPFRVENLHERIDELGDLISEAVAEDPNGPALREWELAVSEMKREIVLMRGKIVEQIEQ